MESFKTEMKEVIEKNKSEMKQELKDLIDTKDKEVQKLKSQVEDMATQCMNVQDN